jgi:copper chaperone CopZ
MKKLIFLLTIALFIFSCQSTGEKKSGQEVQVDPENIQFVEISVEGMTCTGCENTVEKVVLSLNGVMEVEASHTTKTAIVKYDMTKATPDDMMTKIAERGYEALEYKIKEETE